MPRFQKSPTKTKKRRRKRFFSSESVAAKTPQNTKKTGTKKTTPAQNKENVKTKIPDTASQAKVIDKTASSNTNQDAAKVSEIERRIEQSVTKLRELEEKRSEIQKLKSEHSFTEDDPEVYDGVSSGDEQYEYLKEQLIAAQRQAKRFEHELKVLKTEHEQEKKYLEKKIKELKKELHRTAPLHENKFFSLSKELREAVKAVEDLSENINHPQYSQISPGTLGTQSAPTPLQSVTSAPTGEPKRVENTDSVAKKKPKNDAQKPKSKKKKLLITGGAAAILIIGITAILTMQVFSEPKVDQSLVESYLANSGGQVQGTTDSNSVSPISNTGTSQTSDNKHAESLANVTYDEAQWDKFTDHQFQISLEFPKNAVNIIKTDSSVTFIRKTGYIFKVQLIETGLELEDYWQQVKATSLNYKVSETEISGVTALKLELEDITDYPGDKYLVKRGEYVYDIWYATAGNKLSQDDIKMAQNMIETFEFLEQ